MDQRHILEYFSAKKVGNTDTLGNSVLGRRPTTNYYSQFLLGHDSSASNAKRKKTESPIPIGTVQPSDRSTESKNINGLNSYTCGSNSGDIECNNPICVQNKEKNERMQLLVMELTTTNVELRKKLSEAERVRGERAKTSGSCIVRNK